MQLGPSPGLLPVFELTHAQVPGLLGVSLSLVVPAVDELERRQPLIEERRVLRPRENMVGVNMVLAWYPQNTLYHRICIVHV